MLLFYALVFFGQEACGILAPWPGTEPAPPALEGEVSGGPTIDFLEGGWQRCSHTGMGSISGPFTTTTETFPSLSLWCLDVTLEDPSSFFGDCNTCLGAWFFLTLASHSGGFPLWSSEFHHNSGTALLSSCLQRDYPWSKLGAESCFPEGPPIPLAELERRGKPEEVEGAEKARHPIACLEVSFAKHLLRAVFR